MREAKAVGVSQLYNPLTLVSLGHITKLWAYRVHPCYPLLLIKVLSANRENYDCQLLTTKTCKVYLKTYFQTKLKDYEFYAFCLSFTKTSVSLVSSKGFQPTS